MANEPTDYLTAPAREAIRGYMLRLISLPAVFLTLVSGVGGFFLNKVAFQEGYTEGYKTVIQDIMRLSLQVSEVKGKSDATLAEMIKSATLAREVVKEAKDNSDKASKILTDDMTKLAEEVASTPKFRAAAMSVAVPALGDLRKDIKTVSERVGPPAKFCLTSASRSGSYAYNDSLAIPLSADRETCRLYARAITGDMTVRSYFLGCMSGDPLRLDIFGPYDATKATNETVQPNACGW